MKGDEAVPRCRLIPPTSLVFFKEHIEEKGGIIVKSIDFSTFYNYQELTDILKDMTDSAPDLLSLSSIAETPEGRKVWCVEVTNKRAERPIEVRPGYLAQGNMHAVELAGSTVCLYLLKYLVEGYQSDPEVRRILDEQVFYIIPRVAVDGAEYVLTSLHEVRSRRVDVKERNVPYPQDLDGDGKILFMRWQSEDGTYKVSEKDSRLLIPKEQGEMEGAFYHMCVEGLINEWDGEGIATSRAFCDFNRNFPANWSPMPGVIGQGRYPLSEPETRGLAEFVLSHPNIVNAVDLHTGNSAVFLPAAAVKGRARFPQDTELFNLLGRRAREITGFPLLGGYDEIKTGSPTKGLPGTFNDWLYEHLGICSFIIELGDLHNYLGISTEEYCSFERVSEREERIGLALLRWHDENPQYKLFFDWKPYDHPQLGRVEIGGWNWSLWRNPPLPMMEEVSQRCTTFLLEHASYIPRVEITNVYVVQLSDDLFKLRVDVVNRGKAPTNITRQGLEMNPNSNLTLRVEGSNELEFIIGKKYQEIGHLSAFTGKKRIEWLIQTPYDKTISLEVKSDRVYAVKKVYLR